MLKLSARCVRRPGANAKPHGKHCISTAALLSSDTQLWVHRLSSEDSGTLYSLLPPIAEVLLECSLIKSPSAEAGKKKPENVHLDKCPESEELNQALPSQDTRALDTLL